MSLTFKSPASAQEWEDYFKLRWQILRAPWHQPIGSERDELESEAFHVMATTASNEIVGTGRLHRLSENEAQIRYMAVAVEYQCQGIGSQILSLLEKEARSWHCKSIVLNARSSCLTFYLRYHYLVVDDAPTLFGSITHKHMSKPLT